MIEDPLKPLDEIGEPDARSGLFVGGLTEHHRALQELGLSPTVPEDVQQHFETAKNVSLYAWFAFRFHQVSESVALQALEMGLRARFNREPGNRARRTGLAELLKLAANSGLIREEELSGLRDIVRRHAFVRNAYAAIGAQADAEEVLVPEVTEADIERELAEAAYVESLAVELPRYRNELAHGSAMLRSDSRWTLRVVANFLNQLFRV